MTYFQILELAVRFFAVLFGMSLNMRRIMKSEGRTFDDILFIKDVSISRDGLVVSNDLIVKTVEEEGYKIVKTIKIDKDRFAFKIEPN